MTQNSLHKYKKAYVSGAVPPFLAQNGWTELRVKLDSSKGSMFALSISKAFIFALILIFITTGAIWTSRLAKPGTPLYSVEVLSDSVFAKMTGNYTATVEKRVDDVVGVSTDSIKKQDEVAKQYQNTLDSAKQEAEKKGQQENFRKSLDAQVEKLKKAQIKNPKSESIDRAIQETEKTRGEVKGQKTENKSSDLDRDHKSEYRGNESRENNSSQNNKRD